MLRPQMRMGAWSVDPATNQITRDGKTVRLEARTMRLLLPSEPLPRDPANGSRVIARKWAKWANPLISAAL